MSLTALDKNVYLDMGQICRRAVPWLDWSSYVARLFAFGIVALDVGRISCFGRLMGLKVQRLQVGAAQVRGSYVRRGSAHTYDRCDAAYAAAKRQVLLCTDRVCCWRWPRTFHYALHAWLDERTVVELPW